IRSPLPSAFFIAPKTVSTACSALVRLKPVLFTTAFTMSSLITPASCYSTASYARHAVAGCQAGRARGIGKDHRIPLAELKCMSPKRVKELDSYLGLGGP